MAARPGLHIEVSWVGARRSRRLDPARVRRAARVALRRHGCLSARIGIALMDDAAIAALNESYLGHAGATDVITFPLATLGAGSALEGEIAVSVETAAREARRRGHSLEAELALYVIHGVLHLLGHEDKTPRGARLMHAEEDRLLTDLGYGDVYARRKAS